MGAETISTHTVKNGATTTILTRTTTIVSEEEILTDPKDPRNSVVENVKRSFRDYWFPSLSSHDSKDDDEEADEPELFQDPSRFRPNSVMRRAYDYWKSLTQDADQSAKELVIKAKKARDEAAIEAKWAFLGYKKEAREAFEKADQKYREALAAAERVHAEAHEKAKYKWFQAVDKTEKEVGEIKDQASDVTHQKWDRFKAAVDSLAFNPPKYGCSPTAQYWFSRQSPTVGTEWDCTEIWDHPSRHDHRHNTLKTLPKRHVPTNRVHDALMNLFRQAGTKAKNAPSATTFEPSLKPVRDHYYRVLERVARDEQGAIEELEEMVDKINARLNEAKYFEEQTDSWLTSQWNAVIDNAGETKDQYQRALKNVLKNIKHTRNEVYSSLHNNLLRSINVSRNNIREAVRATKDQVDKSRVHKAIQDATNAFSTAVEEVERKIKTAPRNAYDHAIETFERETAHLKAKLERAASIASKSASSATHKASKSGSSISHHASKSGASISHHASKSGASVSHHASKSVESAVNRASKSASSISHHASKSMSSVAHRVTDDAKHFVDEAHRSASNTYKSATDKARDGYEHATASASSMWGSATFAPLHKVHDSYHRMLGDVHSQWFGAKDYSEMNASSVYGAFLALYFVFLAQRIWRNRRLSLMTSPTQTTFKVVKNNQSGDHLNGAHHAGQSTITKVETYKRRPSTEESLEQDRNSSTNVLLQFTSVVPVTLILLVLLELAGFSRVALHALFIGLVTSQLLQGGILNGVLEQLGIVDGVHASGQDIGAYLSWIVLGLAAVANTVKVLHD
ncbi:hypothetical protein BGZ51_008000 [Haplosporangium sp. Z 767]|nr:hypothetical protein BGZ51_008000 [Haplosporangium sp. Z 767]KAF9191122.1 hypothetical protein BGZ50_009650 [Haplosporangium sp. Z 11]